MQETKISGCLILKQRTIGDERGRLTKVFASKELMPYDLDTPIKDMYVSTSSKNVFRGFHFQVPPHEQVKWVKCLRGRIIDYFIDLRKSSKTFGLVDSYELDGSSSEIIRLAPGIGHAFRSLEDSTQVLCFTSSDYVPEHEQGINFKSIEKRQGIHLQDLIVSDKDLNLPLFEDFKSPF